MAIKHNGYTFTCTFGADHQTLVITDAVTERTAIERARAARWDIVRVRAVSGVPKGKVARTVRLAFCPGCAFTVGVRWK